MHFLCRIFEQFALTTSHISLGKFQGNLISMLNYGMLINLKVWSVDLNFDIFDWFLVSSFLQVVSVDLVK